MEAGVRYFLKVRLNQARPEPDSPGKSQLVVTHWRRFVKSLSAEQRERLEALSGHEDDPLHLAEVLEFKASLTAAQSDLLDKSWRRPSTSRRPDLSYPTERAQRWVFQRTMTLGWTPELFGYFDRFLNYNDASSDSHKSERFGKKYQWIAYHELLARIADNYHFSSWYSDESDKFEGLYQINDREIDPSLPPVPYQEFHDRIVKHGTWPPLAIDFPITLPGSIDFTIYGTDYKAFLNDHATLPRPETVARITDSLGRPWLLLYTHIGQNTPTGEGERRRGRGDQQFYTLNSWLVARPELSTIIDKLFIELKNDSVHAGLMDIMGHVDCCYFGELGWLTVPCPHRRADAVSLISQETPQFRGFATAERYSWEGNIWDCSIEESASAVLPSTYLQQSAGLRWSGADRSWICEGETVICNVEHNVQGADATLLMAREDWLRGFLNTHGMAVAYGVRGERQHLGSTPEQYEWLEFSMSGAYDSANLVSGPQEISLKSNQSRRR